MINKRWFKIIFLVMILLNIAIFYKINSNNYHEALLGRALVLKDIIEKYEKENGKLPESLHCCLSGLKPTAKEMYVFPLDIDDSLAFIHEYDYIEDRYMLIIGDRYPPNLIYIYDTKELIFDSDLISNFGL
ncbi:hypothetical protein [Histophilus somni]|uniref:hypothetical protein n=1 Tax=Histophilus somni TaxID=731 RepID=UPI00003974D2|nr:hypothetical protein [Histophilus somni]ACA31416.1 hypothetical protein HSM_1648 [Histophilus somni 2336]